MIDAGASCSREIYTFFLYLADNGCTVHHVECCYMRTTMYFHCSNFSLDTATVQSQWISKLHELLPGFAQSQNLAPLHEIAKISTHKIVAIPKSQNFVLANNSINKVMFFSYPRINCRYGRLATSSIDKPIKQRTLQKHNRSAFLCICRFGD